MSTGLLSEASKVYLLITPRPLPYTNCCAKVLELSALKTSLDIRVMPIGIASGFKYFRALRVKYMMSAFARPALISSTSLS